MTSRELLRHARARSAQPTTVPQPGRSADGDLPVGGGLVQSAPSPLGPRLSFTHQLREETVAAAECLKPKSVPVHETGASPGMGSARTDRPRSTSVRSREQRGTSTSQEPYREARHTQSRNRPSHRKSRQHLRVSSWRNCTSWNRRQRPGVGRARPGGGRGSVKHKGHYQSY